MQRNLFLKNFNINFLKRFDQTIFSGILLSLGNVYFLIWWVTVGAALISKAVTFGLIGVLSFAVVHWMCDFMWLYFLSAVSFKSGHFFGIRFQKFVYAVCGIFLIFFSGVFLLDAVRQWFA